MIRIFAVSDATGKTAARVLDAALSQFDSSGLSVTRYGGVRSEERIEQIVLEAGRAGGFIVHTLVSEKLRASILARGRVNNVATIDLMGPLLIRLSQLLAVKPRSEPGLVTNLDFEYSRRIDAVEFAVQHDDGRKSHEWNLADIVLVGISRTSKTPLSIYLANQGWKVANVPIVLDVEPPPALFALQCGKVAALTITPERLASLRKVRTDHMGRYIKDYADIEHIRREVAYAFQLFERRRHWALIDVTAKPIEEAAAEIITLLRPGIK